MAKTFMSKMVPRKRDLIRVLESTEISLSDMMRRWTDGIPAEVRAEIMDVYEPVLQVLIALKVRGQ